ncbi:MAG: hypothetical protein LBV77_00115 [Candidatus Adiutrix intracellularis]|nr:hypothetical protein [Candidatus Adiutrix intracellularis]
MKAVALTEENLIFGARISLNSGFKEAVKYFIVLNLFCLATGPVNLSSIILWGRVL